jgi:hypothetical protein
MVAATTNSVYPPGTARRRLAPALGRGVVPWAAEAFLTGPVNVTEGGRGCVESTGVGSASFSSERLPR